MQKAKKKKKKHVALLRSLKATEKVTLVQIVMIILNEGAALVSFTERHFWQLEQKLVY